MKRIFITLSLTLICLFAVETANTQTNCISQGKSLIDVYYGFPNLYSTIIEQGYNNNFDLTRGMRPSYSNSFVGPVGFKFERMITDQIGVGLNVFYANTTIQWSDNSYSYKTTVERIRVAVTGNWHFATTAKFDPYFMAHVGYANYNYKFDAVANYDSIPASPHPKPDIQFMIPIALRVGMGARYFFNNNLGVNAEVGLGGIFLTAGLTYKW